jgi:hypothetical protein
MARGCRELHRIFKLDVCQGACLLGLSCVHNQRVNSGAMKRRDGSPGSGGWDIEGHHRQDNFAVVVAGIAKHIS